MPNDTITLDVKIDDWIEKFNKAKGWKRLKAPRPEVLDWRDENQEFRSSGEERFERKLEVLGDTGELTKEIDQAKQSKLALELQRVTATEDELKKINETLKELEQAILDKTAEKGMVEMLEKMLANVKVVEANLPKDLIAQQDRLQKLEEKLDEDGSKVGDYEKSEKGRNDAAGFIRFHDDVARNIENFRQEVIPLTETGKNGLPVTRNYATINSDEYKILFGMLEEALLLFQLGKIDNARAAVQKAMDQAWVYRNARTGAERVAPPETFGKAIDNELALAHSAIMALERNGYTIAATAYKTSLDDLTLRLRGAVNTGKSDIEDTFLGEAERLSEGATIDLERTREIAKHLAKAMQDVDAMRSNGHEDRPQRIVDMIEKFIPGVDLSLAVDAAEKIAAEAARLLERTLDHDLKKVKVDPVKLEQDLKNLTDRYDKLFKHDSSGNVKTQKDTKTGQLKGVKKNADLPRETLEEIDLRIKAAQQLLGSDSVAALQIAQTYVDNVNIFMTNIDNSPQWYADFADKLKFLTSDYNSVEKDFAAYEVGKRVDIKADLDKLKKDYLTKPQREVEVKYDELVLKLGEYETLCKGLRSQKRALFKVADEIEKTQNKMGEVLKKDFTITSAPTEDEAKFTGYYGRYREELADGRALIERRTVETLKQAQTDLTKLKLDTDRGLKLLQDYVAYRKKGKGSMSETDIGDAKDLMREAGQGQQKHNADEKAKPTFEKAVEELERQSGIVEGLQTKLKSDPSTREALDGEIEGIKKEVKADKSYVEGLERLKPLSARMARLLLEASGAADIVDARLPEAAGLVVRHVTGFRDDVKAFYKVIENADDAGDIAKGVYDAKKINDFLNSIVAAIPQGALDQLQTATAVVADTGKSVTERKAARKTALAAVRALATVLDSFKPTAHFRLHSFTDVNAVTALNAARLTLPRLEMRLLTAIAD